MSGRSLLTIICALVAGILVGQLPRVALWMALIPSLSAVAAFIAAIIISKKNPFRSTPLFNETIAALLFLGIGIFSAGISKPSVTSFEKGEYWISGIVSDYTPTNYGDRLIVELHSIASPGGELLKIRNVKCLLTLQDPSSITYGDKVTALASLQSYDTPGNYLKPDYESYLKSKHILLTGFASGSDCRVEGKRSHSLIHQSRKLRDRMETGIENTRLGRQTKGFLISVLLGDKTYLNSAERMKFTDAGVAHIFAVSGMHVSMMAMFMLSILSLFFIGRRRHWKFLLILPPIWFYILIVGFSPATVRAGIMLTIGMVALFLQRKNDPLTALGWAIVMILAFDADTLFDVGFQLSVVCVGSLLIFARPINFVSHRSHPMLYCAVSVITVTLIATFSSWMICAFYFHRFSLLFLPLNLLAVPLLPFFIAISILYIVWAQLWTVPSFLTRILDSGYSLFSHGAERLSELDTALTDLHPDSLSVFLWIGGLICLWYTVRRNVYKGRERKQRFVGAAAACLCFAAAVVTLIVLPAGRQEGLIVQRNSKAATLMRYSLSGEELVEFPADVSSSAVLDGRKVLVLRSEDSIDDIRETLKTADVIIIADGCRGFPESLASLKKEGAVVVTHPSLHWRYEKKILSAAAESGLEVHSLRYDGPLHIFN